MLSIIWGILKVIGLVLLIILGLLLAAILLVLFAPVRYTCAASGKYEKEAETLPEFLVKGRVSWLFRLVCIRIRADREGQKVQVKLFGIPVRQKKEKQQKEIKEKQKKRKKREPELKPGPVQRERLKTASVAEEETVAEEKETEEPEKTAEAAETVQERERMKPEKKKGLIRKISVFFHNIREFLAGIFHNLRCTFEKLCAKIKKISDMAGEIRDFLGLEENQEAFRYVKEETGKLFSHILPKKLSGQVIFGLEDPADTGKALMALGIMYPVIGKRLSVTPLFENKLYVEGDLSFQGRIRLFSLLIIVKRVWFNKRFRGLLERSRELREHLSRA